MDFGENNLNLQDPLRKKDFCPSLKGASSSEALKLHSRVHNDKYCSLHGYSDRP